MLRFSPEDWDRPQTVTVTGVDDSKRDGTRAYHGEGGALDLRRSALPGTGGGQGRPRQPRRRARLPRRGAATLVTSDRAPSATFRVVLNRAPTATVRLPLSSSDEGEGKVSPAELVFEPDNWSQPRTVTVLGLDDDEQDGSQAYQVVIGRGHQRRSGLPGYRPAGPGRPQRRRRLPAGGGHPHQRRPELPWTTPTAGQPAAGRGPGRRPCTPA